MAEDIDFEVLKKKVHDGVASATETIRYFRLAEKSELFTEDTTIGELMGRMLPVSNEPKKSIPWDIDANKPLRPDWDYYFLGIADAVAARADCTRRQVGAVVVDINRRIIGTGYNGAHSGGPSCLAGECPRGNMSTSEVPHGSSYDTGAGSCIALHAEQNALTYDAGANARRGGTIYITTEPCGGCLRLLKGSGLKRVVFWSASRHLDAIELQWG